MERIKSQLADGKGLNSRTSRQKPLKSACFATKMLPKHVLPICYQTDLGRGLTAGPFLDSMLVPAELRSDSAPHLRTFLLDAPTVPPSVSKCLIACDRRADENPVTSVCGDDRQGHLGMSKVPTRHTCCIPHDSCPEKGRRRAGRESRMSL